MPLQRQGTFENTTRPLKILHVVPTFFPATYWGGPIYSVYGLCNALAIRSNIALRALTTDSAGPKRRERLSTHAGEFVFPSGYTVYYARRRFGVSGSLELLRKLWPMIRWADVVHLTGVYSFPTIPVLFGARILSKPIVWSPRGSLQRWEKSRRRYFKRAWEFVCNQVLNSEQCMLHVTSEEEARESLEKIRCARTETIPNGVEIPEIIPPRDWRRGGVTRLLYMGRLDPKKGIENLLGAMKLLDNRVSLTICGAGEPAYELSLRKRVDDLELLTRVKFVGYIEGPEKSRVFWQSDICVVPSYTENFAMVVAEALAHGVPVVASTGTPWKRLVEQGCGMWVSNEPESLAQAIGTMQQRDSAEMGHRGRAWMQREYSWQSIAQRMEGLYRELIFGSHV